MAVGREGVTQKMIMLCANDSKTKGQQSACGSKEIGPPFPFPLWGKPGREGSPHAAEDGCSPHKRAAPPCESPALFAQGIDRTGLLMEGTVTGPERVVLDEGAKETVINENPVPSGQNGRMRSPTLDVYEFAWNS